MNWKCNETPIVHTSYEQNNTISSRTRNSIKGKRKYPTPIQTYHYNGRKFLLCFPTFISENYDYNISNSHWLSNLFNKQGKIFDLMALDTFHDFQYNEGNYMITIPTNHSGTVHQLFPRSHVNIENKNSRGFDCFNKHKNYTNDDIDKHYGYIFNHNGSYVIKGEKLINIIQSINQSGHKIYHSIDTSYGYYAIDKDYCGNINIDELGNILTSKSDKTRYIASIEYKQNTGYIFTLHYYINNKFKLFPIVCEGAPTGIVIGNNHTNYELYHKNINSRNSYNRVDEANNVFQHLHSFERKYHNEGDLCNVIHYNSINDMECIFWVSFCFSTYETDEGYEFCKDKIPYYIYFFDTYEEVEQLHITCNRLNVFILGGMVCKSKNSIYNGIYLTYFGVNQNYKHSFIGLMKKDHPNTIETEICSETDTINGRWIVINRNIKMIFVNVSKFEYKPNEYHNSRTIISEISKVAFDKNKITQKCKKGIVNKSRSVIGGNIIQNEYGFYCHFFHRDFIFYRSFEGILQGDNVFNKLKTVFRIHYFNKQFGDFSNIININILFSKLKPEEQIRCFHNYIFHTGDKTACLYSVLCGINTIFYHKMDNKYSRIVFIDKNKDYIRNNYLKQSKQIVINKRDIDQSLSNSPQILLLNKNEYVYNFIQ